jgi:D-sedoheptulose 7-phosphate isomerase
MINDNMERHIESLIARVPSLSVVEKQIKESYLCIEECYRRRGKLLVAGNGGSAADAEHIVGELMKRFKIRRPLEDDLRRCLKNMRDERADLLAEQLEAPLTAISLASHSALSTACINDTGASIVFAQQLLGFGQKNDVFLGISTSGNSENIINAAITAKAMGISVIGLTGANGGELAKYSDTLINVPQTDTYLVQELHESVYHCLCLMLEDHFFSMRK